MKEYVSAEISLVTSSSHMKWSDRSDFSRRRISPQTRELQCNVPKKCRIAAKIALPQAPGVLHKPMEPLETCAFDPRGAVTNGPGVKIEGGSYAEHERHLQVVYILRHELLLLRSA